MTVSSHAIVRPAPAASGAARSWIAPVARLGGLGAIVAVRWAATRVGFDPLLVGAAFGAALLGLSVVGRRPHARFQLPTALGTLRRLALPLAIGAVTGIALVAITMVGSAIAGPAVLPGIGRPAAPLIPWAAITIVVAAGEEAVLRGRAFDALRRVGGLPGAVLLTTVAFALMHVPLYGWGVVPLDLAVGLVLAGLRIATRGVAAPAAAHAVADLATWWL